MALSWAVMRPILKVGYAAAGGPDGGRPRSERYPGYRLATRLRTELSARDSPLRCQLFHSHDVQKLKANADSTSVMLTFMVPCAPQAGHVDEANL